MGRGSRAYLDSSALQGSNRVSPSLSYTKLAYNFRPQTLRAIFFAFVVKNSGIWILWNMGKVEFSPERVQKTHTIAFQCARLKNEKTKNKNKHLHLCFSLLYVNVTSMCGKFLGLWWVPARYSKEKANAYHDGIAFQRMACEKMFEWMATCWAQSSLVLLLTVIHGTPSQRCLHIGCPGLLPLCTGQLFAGKTLMWVSLFTYRFGCGCSFHRFVCKPQISILATILG